VLALASTDACAAAEGVQALVRQDATRLIVPYPLTGPREIQATDRITPRYRAVAAHSIPPVSDVMGAMVSNALVTAGHHVARERQSLTRFEAEQRRTQFRSLLLAGHEIVRALEKRASERQTKFEGSLVLIEPIAVMPFVLMCSTLRCNSAADLGPTLLPVKTRLIGTAGQWSTSHLGASLLQARMKENKTLIVPYTGGSEVVTALAAGNVDAAFVPLPLALGHLGPGRVRVLGLAAERRFSLLPELTTLVELGNAGLVVEGWFALFAGSGIAIDTAVQMAAAVRAYRLEDASRMELLTRGLIPSEATAAEFTTRLAAERSRN
jgi:ABC-type amino acid transport substrate-binding protein